MWDLFSINRSFCEVLWSIEEQLCAQGIPYGLDSHSETRLHPLLAQAFAHNGHGVVREVGYPTSPIDRPNETQRQRCDLVLTPNFDQAIFDPIDEQRTQDQAVGTLFEAFVQDSDPSLTPSSDMVPPKEAFWVEVKSVGQYSYVEGVPGPNTNYTNELLKGPREDIVKLASDSHIHHAASLIVLFTEYRDAGQKDITTVVNEMLNHKLPVQLPVLDSFPITNHAGNEWCTLGLIPLRL